MNGYERRKQKKAGQIYSAAFELFSKYGYQKVNINEIAHAANVSPATIYNYFGTKEQLYTDTLINWMDKQLEHYERLLDAGRPFPDITRDIMLLEADHLKPLSNEFRQAPAAGLGGLTEMMDKYGDQKVARFFTRYIAAGKQAGYIRQDLPEEVAMRYFRMFLQEWARLLGSAQEERHTAHIDHWTDLFFYGLAGAERQTH